MPVPCLAATNAVQRQRYVMLAHHRPLPDGSVYRRRFGVGGMKQLLLEMQDDLKRFALARHCDPGEVDDLLQELFIKLSTSGTGQVGNPRAYLYQMTNNLIHDMRRGRMRQERRDDGWARTEFGQELLQHPGASPERLAIDRQMLAQVDAAIDEMPERTAQILRRYRVEGQSQKQIAGELGISLSAVEKHLQRAYRSLMELRVMLDEAPRAEKAE